MSNHRDFVVFTNILGGIIMLPALKFGRNYPAIHRGFFQKRYLPIIIIGEPIAVTFPVTITTTIDIARFSCVMHCVCYASKCYYPNLTTSPIGAVGIRQITTRCWQCQPCSLCDEYAIHLMFPFGKESLNGKFIVYRNV